ncbi:MAG: nuclear transport factor 2 family protein [Planctomycetes bacterium]|nr:nuclear transport factor 2 family protein [Planctomycetota bacterium]
MKTINGICMAICLALALAACGGGNNSGSSTGGGGGGDTGGGGGGDSTPAAALDALNAAFKSADVDKIVACYHLTDAEKTELKEGVGEFKEIWDAGGSIRLEYKEEDIKVDGDKAEVKATLWIKEKADGEEFSDGESYQLEKKDGTWKCVPRK